MNSVKNFIKKHNLSGGEAMIAIQLLKEGLSEEAVENKLLDRNIFPVQVFLDASHTADFLENNALDARKDSPNDPKMAEFAKNAEKESKYIRTGLQKIFFGSGKEVK
jgi:hypothetical protein